MWNPLSKRPDRTVLTSPDPPERPEDGHVPGPGQRPEASADRIADVQMMGRTVVATLTITELSQEVGAAQLADLLESLSNTDAQHVILDVQNVQYMDSACLGCMVEALNRISVRGGRIAVVNPNHSVHYIFRLTRLDRVFLICSNVPAALEAVERTAKAG